MGPARQGLGAYFHDPAGLIYNEGRCHDKPPDRSWAERELVWRPSRRLSVAPTIANKEAIEDRAKITDKIFVPRVEILRLDTNTAP